VEFPKIPDIRFVNCPGARIAFQVFGDGPELLCVPGLYTNQHYQWDFSVTSRFFDRLASFARITEFDRRGCGLSERLSPDDLPPLEVLVSDIAAVQDAAGFGRCSVFGWMDGGAQAAVFAAFHPERVAHLILYCTSATGIADPDYPWQWSREEWAPYLAAIEEGWGTTEFLEKYLREWGSELDFDGDPRLVREAIAFYRAAGTGRSIAALERLFRETDIRGVLPSIKVPTLVLHRAEDALEQVDQARYIAKAIPNATLIELPGTASGVPWAGDQDALLEPIAQVLTGRATAARVDRVLSTVMFTDIVDSTRTASRLSDRGWGDVLGEHLARSRRSIELYHGRMVKNTGDGVLARFKGPASSVRCALEIRDSVADLGIAIRGGCHTGEVELVGDDVRGLAVHIGARVMSLAGANEVYVSSTVKDLTAGSGLRFEDVGEHELKGVPDRWRLYRATG
jgi:pimeloyl-ACP methyl ester carboxylesterase